MSELRFSLVTTIDNSDMLWVIKSMPDCVLPAWIVLWIHKSQALAARNNRIGVSSEGPPIQRGRPSQTTNRQSFCKFCCLLLSWNHRHICRRMNRENSHTSDSKIQAFHYTRQCLYDTKTAKKLTVTKIKRKDIWEYLLTGAIMTQLERIKNFDKPNPALR